MGMERQVENAERGGGSGGRWSCPVVQMCPLSLFFSALRRRTRARKPRRRKPRGNARQGYRGHEPPVNRLQPPTAWAIMFVLLVVSTCGWGTFCLTESLRRYTRKLYLYCASTSHRVSGNSFPSNNGFLPQQHPKSFRTLHPSIPIPQPASLLETATAQEILPIGLPFLCA